MAIALLLLQLTTAALTVAGQAGNAAATPSSERPLTLAAAVTQARTASPRREAAAVVAEGTRAAARLAGRLPNPFFDFRTENWTSSRHPLSPSVDLFAEMTQPIEIGGKRSIRRQLAVSDGDRAAAALRSLERDLAMETVHAYVRALRARAVVETLTGNREGLTTLVTSMGRRVEEGYSAEADLLKFMTERARVDGDIARAQLELERSLAALTIVIGAAAPIDPSRLVEPAPLPVPTADGPAIAARIALHPDVVAAGAGVEQARQASAFERARRLPDAAVTAGYKRTGGFDTLTLAVAFAVPLFDHNAAAIARVAGAERGVMAERDALVYQLATDAASVARAAQTMAGQAERAPKELLEPAEEVRRAALAAFREGTADVLQLIDAERVYADVRRAAVDLRLDALLTAIEARFALGEEAIP